MTSIMKRIVQTYTCCETKLGRLSCLAIFLALSVLGGCSNGGANAEGVLSAGVAVKSNVPSQDSEQVGTNSSSEQHDDGAPSVKSSDQSSKKVSSTKSSPAADGQVDAKDQGKAQPGQGADGGLSGKAVAGEQPAVTTPANPKAQFSTRNVSEFSVPESAKGNAALVQGPLPVSYLRPASAVLDDQDDLVNQADAYKRSKEASTEPEAKLWFQSNVVDMVYDANDDADWSQARYIAVARAYLDCLGQYSAWLSSAITVQLSDKSEQLEAPSPLMKEFLQDARESQRINPNDWTSTSIRASAEAIANNYVGGLAVNKIFWGKDGVVVVCVVTETTRRLQGYIRGALSQDGLPKLQPMSNINDLLAEKGENLHQLSGGVFYWVDEKGSPLLYTVGTVVVSGGPLDGANCEMIAKSQLSLFLGAQVFKGTLLTLSRDIDQTKVKDGTKEGALLSVAKGSQQLLSEITAESKINVGGVRLIAQKRSKLNDSRLLTHVYQWSPTEQDIAAIRKAEQEQLKKYNGRNLTGDLNKAGNKTILGKGSSGSNGDSGGGAVGGKPPLEKHKTKAPNGKGDSGSAID